MSRNLYCLWVVTVTWKRYFMVYYHTLCIFVISLPAWYNAPLEQSCRRRTICSRGLCRLLTMSTTTSWWQSWVKSARYHHSVDVFVLTTQTPACQEWWRDVRVQVVGDGRRYATRIISRTTDVCYVSWQLANFMHDTSSLSEILAKSATSYMQLRQLCHF